MKYLIDEYIGHGPNLDSLQMICRAFALFFIALFIIRISGMRSFGSRSAFDVIITIMLGAILSRAVVGANEFIPTCAAGATLGVIHRILALLSVRFDYVGRLIKGASIPLYDNKTYNKKNMFYAGISKKDMMEEVHEKLNIEGLDMVQKIYMERSGKISIIKKQL